MANVAKPRRRWYQFGLGELLSLIANLAVVWWQASRWSVTAYDKGVAETPFEDIMYTSLRSPSTLEVAERGLVGSTVVIALWFFGRGVRRRLRRKGAPYRQDAEPWLWINGDGVSSACHLQMQFVYVIANVARLFIR
jgi:hypothetical protein